MGILFNPTPQVRNKEIRFKSQNIASAFGCEKYPNLTLTLERPVGSKKWCVRCRDHPLPKDPTKVDIVNEPKILFTTYLDLVGSGDALHVHRLSRVYITILIRSHLNKLLKTLDYDVPNEIIDFLVRFIAKADRI